MVEPFEPRKRSRVYRGRCSTCGKQVPILVNAEYDPLLSLSYYPSTKILMECLKCGSIDVSIYAREERAMREDIRAWRQRVDFTERVKPRVKEKIIFQSELEDFMKELGEGREE